MDFLKLINGKTHFKVSVKTNKPKTQLVDYSDDVFKMDVKAQPIEGKANIEIVRFFKKNYKIDVEIVSGATSRIKLFKVL